MKLSSFRKEVIIVLLSSLTLTVYCLFLSFPNIQQSISQILSSEILLQRRVQFPVIAISALLLYTGLIIGIRRHRDISPLTFATLGISVLPLYIFWNLPLLIPALCSICFFVAGIWSLVLPENKKNLQDAETPSFDAFLDNTILTEETCD